MGISKQMKLSDYEGFVDKFVPKKTTDDCYTPQAVYDEVLKFVGELTDLTGREVVRPFWPGGDYERYDYPEGCVVVDNPPFSIYTQVVKFYLRNKIDFFLFAPALTQTINGGCCCIVTGVNITYENGAVVPTSFTTSLCKERVWCCPDLYQRLDRLNPKKNSVGKLHVPVNVITPALLQKISKYGVDLKIAAEDAACISRLDNYDKSLYGNGWLLSDRAAADRAAADRAAADRAAADRAAAGRTFTIELSEREKAMVEMLNKQSKPNV